MPRDERPPAWFSWVAVAGCAAFALPLLAHAYAGTASRYVGDDYCAGYIFRDYGLIGGQVWHYKSWSAVPTTLLLMAATEPGGARLAPALPAMALMLWVVAATWSIRQLSTWSRASWDWTICLLLAEVLIVVTLQDAPNVAQSVYLRVPMLAYMCPLIVLTGYIGWLARTAARDRQGWGPLAASGALAAVFAAFGPVSAAFMTAATVLAYVAARSQQADSRWRALSHLLIAGCIGSVVALAIVALAPGNATRQAHFPNPPGLLKVGLWSVLYAAFMFCRPVVSLARGAIVAVVPHVLGGTPSWLPTALAMGTSPLPLMIAILTGASLALLRRQPIAAAPPLKRARWWIPVAAFVLVCACMAPGAYGTSAPPPPRALLIPQYVITCLAACWGFAMAAVAAPALEPRVKAISPMVAMLVACLILLVPVAATPAIVRTGATLRQWAKEWDVADSQLKAAHAAGVRDAKVPALESIAGVGSISPDVQDWVNICAAHYYGLHSITGIR